MSGSGGARRLIARLVLASAALPAAAWAIGVPWASSLLLAALGAATVGILAVPSMASEPDWPRLIPAQADGRRREVMSLSWMLTSRHRGVDPIAVSRLRAIARHRLGARGIDLDSPLAAHQQRATALLGERAYRILIDAENRDTTHSELDMCVDRVESLREESRRNEVR